MRIHSSQLVQEISCPTSGKQFFESWALNFPQITREIQTARINQTVEIALRCWLTGNPDVDWVEFLSQLRGHLHNLPNSSAGCSANEIIYSCRVRDTLIFTRGR